MSKYLPLVLAGLWRKPLRTILTGLSVMVAFLLFGVLAGVDGGVARALQAARLDRLFVDPKFTTPMPITYQAKIAAVPGVTVVAPRTGLRGFFQTPKNPLGVLGTDDNFFGARPELSPGEAVIAQLRRTPNGALITPYYVQRFHWKVGDTVSITTRTPMKNGQTSWPFHILGVIDDKDRPGETTFFVANYKYIDDSRATGAGTASRFLVRIADPTKASEVGRTIDAMFINTAAPTRTTSENAAAQSNISTLGDVNFFSHAVVAAVLFMLLFLTASVMMQSTRERIPEFAVLKTLGYSQVALFGLLLAESAILCLVAGAAGLLLAKLTLPVLASYGIISGVELLIMPWTAVLAALSVTLAVALVAILGPALRLQRLNVVDALAGR